MYILLTVPLENYEVVAILGHCRSIDTWRSGQSLGPCIHIPLIDGIVPPLVVNLVAEREIVALTTKNRLPSSRSRTVVSTVCRI